MKGPKGRVDCRLLLLALLLVSCGDGNELSPLPEGEQTVTGILELTELSFVRRGTHMLYMDGVPVYYVESKVVNLSAHEGKSVELTGTLERNTDKNDIPVLVVTSLNSIFTILLIFWRKFKKSLNDKNPLDSISF